MHAPNEKDKSFELRMMISEVVAEIGMATPNEGPYPTLCTCVALNAQYSS